MSEMTLSQGLRAAKKLKGQLAERLERAAAGVVYQASKKPGFPFPISVEMADSARDDLVRLESRIALTNATTTVASGGRTISLSEAVRTLQELKAQISWYKGLSVRAQSETKEDERYYNEDMKTVTREISWQCDLTEAQRAAVVDGLQQKFDDLNDEVERKNHVTRLVP